MKEQTLKSWEEFEGILVSIDEETKKLQEKKRSYVSYPIFRGVRDSKYHLESTLDRIKKEMECSGYQTILKIVHKHVATCTGKKWDLSGEVEYEKGFKLPAYEFMAYLRHNGFPSPLIDWTKSPHIAAYFAFRDIASKSKNVSIFIYIVFVLL